MSEQIRVHNPVAQPVIYTADGHQLDGYTGTMTDPADPITTRLLDQGRIIAVPTPTPPPVIPRPKSPKTTKPALGEEEI